MYRGLYLYPWDLADEGVETIAARARAAGINALSVAASYHAGKFLRPHGVSGKVYFPRDGSIYFKEHPERYGAIKPIRNPLVESFDVFAELARLAPDLDRVAWTVCLHNTVLGERHPEFTARNAYGDSYPYSLSPACPEVQDFVVALCRDLAENYDLSALTLETPGFLPFDHGFHHEFTMLPLDSWAKWLLGLCFNEASLAGARKAGIDAARLRVEARSSLDRYFRDDVAVPDDMAMHWWLADLIADPEWMAFLNWRCRIVTDLVARVRSELPRATKLFVIPTVQRPTAACWLEGSDLAALARVSDGLEVPAYMATAAGATLDIWDVRRRIGDKAHLNVILRPGHPDLAGGSQTVEAALGAARQGIDGIAFYNYGHLRLGALDHVRAALNALNEVNRNGK